MHWGWYGSWGSWGLHWVFMILFWVVVIGGVVLIAKAIFNAGHRSEPPRSDSALDVLKRRYANGEITKDEYLEMKATLS